MLTIAFALAAAAAAQPGALHHGPSAPMCRTAQLSLSVNDDGGNAGMSHNGTELSIRNRGRDCLLPSLPIVEMLDARGRVVARRGAPRFMHPGPVMVPLHLSAGRRAAIELRWVSNEVFDHNHSVDARSVVVHVGAGTLRSRISAHLVGDGPRMVQFEQTQAQIGEGMPAG